MFTVISALAFAVVLALVYSVLAERVDGDTVHRRQFDAWVAIGAFGCWLALASGDLTVRRDIAKRQFDLDRSDARPTEVVRGIVPSLRTPDAPEISPPLEAADDASVPARRIDPDGGEPEPGDEAIASSGYEPAGRSERLSRDDGTPVAISASAAEPSSSESGNGPPAAPLSTAPVTEPDRPIVVIVTPTSTPTSPSITPLVPTSVPPTPDVSVLPTATPHCGTPGEIDFTLRIEQAEAERGDDGLKVRYRARIENRSAFPVTLADITITAQNSASGSDHYGHALRPDISLAPFDRVTIQGSIPLTKSPSPFGRTELCFAMVGETCGVREPYTMRRRCSTVDGF